jgi:dTDP-4-dehydrorhamnose 3,5-epimerase
MQQMPAPEKFCEGEIHDVVVRDLRRISDDRGWLTELFRQDELPDDAQPVMAYISATAPGITRGPHEHLNQADLFGFLGPSNFKLRMWDNREDSATYRNVMTLIVGADNPKSVLIPKGVVHAYQNVGETDGIVINCPNRLYTGAGRREPIDEIRHEDDPHNIFKMDE